MPPVRYEVGSIRDREGHVPVSLLVPDEVELDERRWLAVGYRGRLIFPFLIEVARLDTKGTEDAGAYDADFRTVRAKLVDGERAVGQVYLEPIKLPAQVEDGTYEMQRQTRSGNAPASSTVCVLHFRDLEAAGLVDPATGDALLRTNDRLLAVYRRKDGALAQAMPREGLYATEVKPGGFGLSGGYRNLLIVTFQDRPRGLTGT